MTEEPQSQGKEPPLEARLKQYATNPEFQYNLAQNPNAIIKALKEDKSYTEATSFTPYTPTQDPWVYHRIINILGAVVIIAIVAVVGLLIIDKTPPDSIVALGSTAVGALVAILVPQGAQRATGSQPKT